MAVAVWLLVWLAALLSLALWWHYGHFRRLGMAYLKPLPLVGFALPMVTGSMHLADLISDVYRRLDGHSYGGVFYFLRPTVLIRDPEVLRAVAVKDFNHFSDRLPLFDEVCNPILGRNMVNLKGKKWHDLRGLLSPTYTTSKLKNMSETICDIAARCADQLEGQVLKRLTDADRQDDLLHLDVKDMFLRYSNDVIATTALGVKVDAVGDADNAFYRMGHKLASSVAEFHLTQVFGVQAAPKLLQAFNYFKAVDDDIVNFFKSLIRETFATREKEGITRPDMMHILLQAKNSEDSGGLGERSSYDEEDLVAQAIIMYIGAVEPSSTFLCISASLLTNHPEVQRKLQTEIDQVMEESDGKPSYEQVQGMKYLDMVILEIMRIYTPGFATDRVCVKEYRLPDTPTDKGVTLKPGDAVWFPCHAIHNDPKYFENPQVFDPERFSDANRHKIKPFTYNPFGVGPRFCIGQRLALLEGKILFIYLLSRFDFVIVPRTQVPIRLQPNVLNLAVKGGSWLGLRLRSQKIPS